jgi:ABC-type dipeptide/oligopeptide/nickel transport system permease subunit
MTESSRPSEPPPEILLEGMKGFESSSLFRDAVDRMLANRLAIVGTIIVAILFFAAIAGPLISPYDFLTQDLAHRSQPPSEAHWFGTDDLGRDVLSRVLHGARTATLVAFSVTTVSLLIGVVLGATAGYLGGKVDAAIVWLIDVTMSIPSLLLAVVVNISIKTPLSYWMDDMYLETHQTIFRQTVWIDFALVFGALALIMWPPYARLIRAQILSIRNQGYVLAAQALGLSNRRILVRYIIPNALGPVIVQASAGLGQAMVLESAFSFLGIGVRPPMPSWGNMISDGLRMWRTAPYLLAAPAIVLGIVTVAFSFLGDGLNDALNPKGWK